MLGAILAAAVPTVASIFGASKQAKAEKRAAAVQAAAAQQARADLQPFRETGGNALARLADSLGLTTPEAQQAAFDAFQTTPGYQFQLNQGIDAIDRSAAARGGLFSGNTLRAAQEYGQGLASTEFGNYLAYLGELSRSGQSAAAGQGAAGIAAGNATAGGIRGSANALAQGAYGVSNAITGGIENYQYDQRYNNFLSALNPNRTYYPQSGQSITWAGPRMY